jgi:hypothetical protein
MMGWRSRNGNHVALAGVIKEFDMLLLGFFFPFMSLTSLARAISVPGRGTLIPD